MIVALTGGTGFLGGHVLDRLIAEGHQVRALTRREQSPREGVTWIAGDLENCGTLCEDADAVIHIAGVVNADAATFDKGNRQGTLAILHAAEIARIDRFVHISSLSAREPQLSLYGASKRAAEDAVVTSALDWRVVRPPAIYGPGDTDNLELFKLAKRGIVPLPRGGRLSVIHANDLARLIVLLVADAGPPVLYEADDGKPGGWTHRGYVAAIGAAVGRKPVTIRLPRVVLDLGASLDGRFGIAGGKLTRDRVSYMTHPDWVIDPARRPPSDFWSPQIATPEGLKATDDWYRAAGWL